MTRVHAKLAAANRPAAEPSNDAPAYTYSAFISYKHIASTNFAAKLELALKTYAKPLLARPLRIFRDEKHLVPGPDLPLLIEKALDASEFMILIASPAAAKSPWVLNELDRWCRVLGRTDHLMIVLVDGDIVPTEDPRRIDWNKTTALPEMLVAHLDASPLYVDMRSTLAERDLTLEHPGFKRAVNSISARLRCLDPNEMLGEEILHHRRNLRLRNAALGTLSILALSLGVISYIAYEKAQEAQHERNGALTRESQLLANESTRAMAEGRFEEAIEYALRAVPLR
jgi:hypothetical protein